MNLIFELYNIFCFDKERKIPKGLALYSDGSLYKARKHFNKELSKDEEFIQNKTLILKSEEIAQKVQTILHNYKKEIDIFPTVMHPPFHIMDGQEEFIRLDYKVIYGYNALCSLPYSGNNFYEELTEKCNKDAEQFWTFTKILQEIQKIIGDFGQYLFTGKRLQTAFSIDNKEFLKLYLVKYNYFNGYPLFNIESNEEKIIFSLGKNFVFEKRIILKGNPFCCKLPLDNLEHYITDSMIGLYIVFDKKGIAWCDTALLEQKSNKNIDVIYFAAEKIVFEEDEE